MHFSIDRTVHTTAFDKPVVDHWFDPVNAKQVFQNVKRLIIGHTYIQTITAFIKYYIIFSNSFI